MNPLIIIIVAYFSANFIVIVISMSALLIDSSPGCRLHFSAFHISKWFGLADRHYDFTFFFFRYWTFLINMKNGLEDNQVV